jgi:hypothetical protein
MGTDFGDNNDGSMVPLFTEIFSATIYCLQFTKLRQYTTVQRQAYRNLEVNFKLANEN